MKHIGIFSIIGLLFTAIGAMAASSLPVVATPWTTTTNPATARVALGISTNVMWPLYQTNPTPAQLRAALGLLLPTDIPIISSFVNNQGTLEVGATVNSTVLTWALAGNTVTTQYLSYVGTIAPSVLTATDSSIYSANRTYVLSVGDGNTNVSASTAVTFKQKNYWGASTATAPTDAQIIALSSAFASSRTQTQIVTASAQYHLFRLPRELRDREFHRQWASQYRVEFDHKELRKRERLLQQLQHLSEPESSVWNLHDIRAMKPICLIVIGLLCMATVALGQSIPGTVIAAKITTGNSNNTFSIGDTLEMGGTPKQVPDMQSMTNIPAARRTEGMTCWVTGTGQVAARRRDLGRELDHGQ